MPLLNYLHNQSPPIIHRDVKPQNIKITPHNRAMLVDFGMAKEYMAGEKTLAGAQAQCWLSQNVSSAGILSS